MIQYREGLSFQVFFLGEVLFFFLFLSTASLL